MNASGRCGACAVVGMVLGVVAGGCAFGGAPGAAGAFRFEEQDGKFLHLYEGDRPVLTYNHAELLPDGVPANRQRSSYVHPVYGLDGDVLTDDFPKDHYHHRGVSWMWPRMKAGGQNVSLWDIRGIKQRFARWLRRDAGPDGAILGVENDWVVGEKVVAKETIWLRVLPADAVGRAIDVRLRFEALEAPIELLGQTGKGYGGLCFRFAPRTDTVLTTDQGEQKDSDLRRFPWADLSARFAGREQMSGAAIFIGASNPGFPNGWTLRHYGFLGPCWPGLEPFELKPGEPVTLAYRIWLHRGDASAGRTAQACEAYRAVEKADWAK